MSLRPAILLLLAGAVGSLHAQSARNDSLLAVAHRTGTIGPDADAPPTLPAEKIARVGAKPLDKARAPLPGILVGLDDLGPGMQVEAERIGIDSNGPAALLLAFASTEPLAAYERTITSERMVSTLGDSRLMGVFVAGATFHTRAEANRPLDALALFDLPKLWELSMGQESGGQMTFEGTRTVSLEGAGDRAAGWILDAMTPMGSIEIAFVIATHGRLVTAVSAVAPRGGLQDRDLAGLVRTMDERARRLDGYLADREPDRSAAREAAAADSALASMTDVALNTVPAYPPDTAGLTTVAATVTRENGWPQYALTVEGRGFTFPFGVARAIDVTMTVTLHDTEAEALKEVIAVESGHMSAEDTSGLGELFAEAGATEVETVVVPGLGARAARAHMSLRGMMRLDVDGVAFSRGRISAIVTVTRPAGARDSVDVDSIAREMDRRVQGLLRDTRTAAAPRRLVEAVRRVVEAEHAVDSLIGAREFDAAFGVIRRTQASRPPVGFSASTWNSVCWWASLHGHASRALAACEAAVAPDTSFLGHRDSRGLARALTGDLDGAREDFEFVVAHADSGEIIDVRGAWLDALRAGRNPFTETVLAELRGTH